MSCKTNGFRKQVPEAKTRALEASQREGKRHLACRAPRDRKGADVLRRRRTLLAHVVAVRFLLFGCDDI